MRTRTTTLIILILHIGQRLTSRSNLLLYLRIRRKYRKTLSWIRQPRALTNLVLPTQWNKIQQLKTYLALRKIRSWSITWSFPEEKKAFKRTFQFPERIFHVICRPNYIPFSQSYLTLGYFAAWGDVCHLAVPTFKSAVAKAIPRLAICNTS